MKRFFFQCSTGIFSAAVLLTILILAPGESNAQTAIPDNWKRTSLKDHGYHLSMMLPPDAEIEGEGHLKISAGQDFSIQLSFARKSPAEEKAAMKKVSESITSKTVKSYPVDEETGHVTEYDSKGNLRYGFFWAGRFPVTTRSGTKEWTVTVKDKPIYKHFTVDDCKLMLEAAKSAQPLVAEGTE